MKKYFTLVLGFIVLGAALGLWVYTEMPKATFGASPVGATFANAKFAGVTVSFANATTTWIQNQTGNDLYVSATKIGCEGVGTSNTPYTGTGLASWQFTVGTTSSATQGTTIKQSFADVMQNFVVSTSTGNLLVSSSTLATATSSNAMVWNAGAYMQFATNATNTAVCTVGVSNFSS